MNAASKESAIQLHTEKTTHDIHPRYGENLERNETNYKVSAEFFWSLHSKIDKKSVNERMEFPRAFCAAVKISWEPEYEAVILNFKFIVPRRRTRDTVRKFGKPF